MQRSTSLSSDGQEEVPMDVDSPSSTTAPSTLHDFKNANPSSRMKSSVDYSKLQCLVCGDKASGLHYTVVSCESCKSFFGRKIKSKVNIQCDAGGNCVMDLYTRRHCPACRLQKCLSVGMKPERVWDEKRLETRKPLERKSRKKVEKVAVTVAAQVTPSETESLSPEMPDSPPEMTSEKQQLIDTIIKSHLSSKNIHKELKPTGHLNEMYEQAKSPPPHTQNMGTGGGGAFGFPPNNPECMFSGQQPFQPGHPMAPPMAPPPNNGHMKVEPGGQPPPSQMFGFGEMGGWGGGRMPPEGLPGSLTPADMIKYNFAVMGVMIRQTVFFAKNLPGFQFLDYEDQAVLIKCAMIEILMLRCAECYDPAKDSICDDISGTEWNLELLLNSGFISASEPSMRFVRNMNNLGLLKEEYAILQALTILSSDRPGLKSPEGVEKLQQPVAEAFQLLTKHNHPEEKVLFAKTMGKVTELREICLKHFSDLMNMKLTNQDKLFPLINEIFDLK